jgi:hypothetical protein
MESTDMDQLFTALETELGRLESATARSLWELDAEAGVALSRWLENWTVLDELPAPG